MTALWIILGILGFFALLITVICLLPVYVYVYYDKENSLYYRYRLLWMVFGEVPNPNNPILRLVKDLSGLSRFDSVKSLKKNISSLGVGTTAGQILRVLFSLLREIVWLLPKCRLRKLRLRAVCGAEEPDDAAMAYGELCASVYPAIGVLDHIMPIHRKGLSVDLRCDFEQPESEVDLEAHIRVFLGPVLLALWRVVLDEAKAEAARTAQPAKKSSTQRR